MASSADFQLVVTVLVLVKNCTPALPYLQRTEEPAHAHACAALCWQHVTVLQQSEIDLLFLKG